MTAALLLIVFLFGSAVIVNYLPTECRPADLKSLCEKFEWFWHEERLVVPLAMLCFLSMIAALITAIVGMAFYG